MFLKHLQIWLMAFRPKTLMAAISPVIIGTVLAYAHGIHHFPTAAWALFGALMIQIGTNLANDYFDFKKGADQNRVGPTRVTQAGLVSPFGMKMAMLLVFGLACVAAVVLFMRAGWPIIVIGVVSILSGIFYTAGKKSIGYLGFGDLFVFVFFGPVATAGTYFVQSLELNMAAITAGLGPGFISVAILAVNNLRDVDTDVLVNKKTLAVRFGKVFVMAEYLIAVIAGCLSPIVIFAITREHILSLIAVTSIFWAVPSIVTIFRYQHAQQLNAVLAWTGQLLAVYTVLFTMGYLI